MPWQVWRGNFSSRIRKQEMNPIGLLFVGVGGFALTGAVCNWDWFMNARKVRFMVAILTRTGARILYGLLGAGLVVWGILVAAGVADLR
jgi:hypothetical protein